MHSTVCYIDALPVTACFANPLEGTSLAADMYRSVYLYTLQLLELQQLCESSLKRPLSVNSREDNLVQNNLRLRGDRTGQQLRINSSQDMKMHVCNPLDSLEHDAYEVDASMGAGYMMRPRQNGAPEILCTKCPEP